MKKTFSIKESINYGWHKTEENLWFYIPMLIVVFVINLGLSFLQETAKNTSMFSAVLFGLISVIVSTVVAVGFINIALKIYDGKKVSHKDFFEKNELWFIYFLGSIFNSLIVVGGLFLLIIPGIIWSIRFKFFGYFIVEEGIKPIMALKKSLALTRGYTLQLFKFFLAIIGINLLGIIPLGLGLFVTIPMSMLASVYVYKKLAELKKESVELEVV